MNIEHSFGARDILFAKWSWVYTRQLTNKGQKCKNIFPITLSISSRLITLFIMPIAVAVSVLMGSASAEERERFLLHILGAPHRLAYQLKIKIKKKTKLSTLHKAISYLARKATHSLLQRARKHRRLVHYWQCPRKRNSLGLLPGLQLSPECCHVDLFLVRSHLRTKKIRACYSLLSV